MRSTNILVLSVTFLASLVDVTPGGIGSMVNSIGLFTGHLATTCCQKQEGLSVSLLMPNCKVV